MLPTEEKENKMREKRFLQRRTTICVIIIAVVFFGFAVKLFKWQIIDGAQYKKLATTSTAYTVTTDATRGEILDCNGEGLAVNRTSYRIAIDKLFMKPEKLDKTVLSLIQLMNTRDEKWINVLPIKLTSDNKFKFKDSMADEIKTLKSSDYLNLKASDSADKCVKLLTERYELEKVKNKTDLINLISVHYNMELTAYSNTNPYIFAKNISSDMVAIVSENMQGVSGVEIQTFLTRNSPNGSLAPHVVGALGSISQEEYEAKQKEGKDYGFNDSIGKFGVESAFEDELRGVGGERLVQKDSDGNVTKVATSVDAQPGHTVYLTLDSKLQKVANESLEKQIKAAKANGVSESLRKGAGCGEDCETGAVVMLDVKDFSVLAAASYPSYNLNKYSNYDDYYISLAEDKNAPLYDRAFNGSFAPGSVFKPCVACAALQEGIINSNTTFECTKKYTFYPSNPVACMGYHSYISLNSAITQSCNYYFAETGRLLGIDTMYLYAEKFGLGEKTGLEIAESTGILAGRDSTTWQEGNTVQAAIGQSDNSFTPVQLAAYAATIANDGTRLKTHIVKEIRDYERKKTVYKYNTKKPEKLNTVGVSKGNLNLVQDAMRNVVASPMGTANYIFGNYKIPVAAKTGTAENAGSDHTVFICYAPFDKPKVAIGVVLEHGKYGKYSMNVAKSLLDAYFNN
ncbi:MAG: penicillin-binding protein [Ruminococcus sp.]|nr:penicillin-binding protein [Ruminococcus sp.]